MPWYDQWGWYSATEIPGRYTDVPLPDNIPEGFSANWTGYEWRVVSYVPPVLTTGNRIITKRSFWNRFPPIKEVVMRAIILSGSPPFLAGSLKRLESRVECAPFVDLDLQETRDGILWLASEGVPEYVQIEDQMLPLRLTSEESSDILEKEPTDNEKYNQ